MKARMLRDPRRHRGMLVRAVVIEDEVDVVPAGSLPIDRGQEGEGLGMGMPRRSITCPSRTFSAAKEGGRHVPLIGGASGGPGTPGRNGRIGWVRSNA